MAKSIHGGKKIPFDESIPAQKIYWDALVGKKKIKPEQLPQSVSFSLDAMKSYLSELESDFNAQGTPYDKRFVSIYPLAYDEKEVITFSIIPSVLGDDDKLYSRFNESSKVKKKKLREDPTPQPPPTDALNDGERIP
jgi:hypothetical protein